MSSPVFVRIPPGPYHLQLLFQAAFRPWISLLICLIAILSGGVKTNAQVTGRPTVALLGGIYLPDGTLIPRRYTWGALVGIRGAGWGSSEALEVHIYGPVGLPGVASQDRFIGVVYSDSTGNIVPGIDYNPSVQIPFRTTLNGPNTLRPGIYKLYVTRPNSLSIFDVAYASPNITISPKTIPFYPFPFSILWVADRGGRDGQLEDKSPERGDPEWISVWDEHPVAFYATVAETDLDGGNQPAFISHEDFPGTHYAHDVNLLLTPDPAYQWLLADANFNISPSSSRFGRIEWEWETLNNGSPYVGSYGAGNIGLPLWVMPSAGDRVFTVGRWAMDNGHPDSGDRTEIHPPRMLATMRQRNTAVPFANTGVMTRAAQVDVYVSGHGGGSNMFPDGLSSALNNGGLGGGNLTDAITPDDRYLYFSYGPSTSTLASIITTLLGGNSDQIKATAGPSALGWNPGPEERPVNDMDYDFDVPLPAPPPGSYLQFGLHPLVQVITRAQHTTGVKEVITYTNYDSVTGLPTTAHIHLPYNGADSGIYARTLKFYWSEYNAPGKHYSVKFNEIVFFLNTYMTGRAYMWADVCGQWEFLTGINPHDFLRASTVLGVGGLDAASFDVYLDPADSMRVFTQGYDQEVFDTLFGADVGKTSYEVSLDLAEASVSDSINTLGSGDGENVDLGGALYRWPASNPSIVGRHTSSAGYFYEDFTVNYIPRPPKIVVTGVPVNFGHVALGTSSPYQTVSIVNRGENPDHSTGSESPLTITAVTVTGAGFSVVPDSPLPYTVTGGLLNLSLAFSPTSIGEGAGKLTIRSNDPLNPVVTFNLTGIVDYPIIQVTSPTTVYPTVALGGSTTWPVTVTNAGTSTLIVNTLSISGSGFTVTPTFPTPDGIRQVIALAPGRSAPATVQFSPPQVGTKFTGLLTLGSNDPIHSATTLTFGAEGAPVGVRVLVVGSDGMPYPVVDDIRLKYSGKPKANEHLKELRLIKIDPPASWQRIQYHYMTALTPTDGSNTYELRVQVGSKKRTVTFSLGAGEFRQLQVTLP